MIVTDHMVYGNTQVMRRGFRAAGLGSKMIKAFLFTLREDLKKKPLVGRAGICYALLFVVISF